MTTPEQLAKLTNDAKLAYFNDGTIGISHEPIEAYVSGYLRRCQETEQIMKLAKFGVMAVRKWVNDAHGVVIYPDLDDTLIESIVNDVFDDEDINPEIKISIKELLK